VLNEGSVNAIVEFVSGPEIRCLWRVNRKREKEIAMLTLTLVK